MPWTRRDSLDRATLSVMDQHTTRDTPMALDPDLERWNLALGLLAIPAFLIAVIWGASLESSSQQVLRAITGFLFLNVTHTLFTLVMLATLPEFKTWLRSKPTSLPVTNLVRILVVSLLILSIGATIHLGPGVKAEWVLYGWIAMVILRSQHILGQCRGVVALYNSRLGGATRSNGTSTLSQVMRWERWGFRFILVDLAVMAVMRAFKVGDVWIWFAVICGLIVASAMIAVTIWRRQEQGFNKTVYMLRLLLFPLALVNFAVNTIKQSLHGFEYLLILIQLRRRSGQTGSTWGLFAILALTSAFSIMFLSHAVFPSFFRDWNPRALALLLTFSFWNEYGHYYLDSVLFRFRDPNVKDTIGALLVRR